MVLCFREAMNSSKVVKELKNCSSAVLATSLLVPQQGRLSVCLHVAKVENLIYACLVVSHSFLYRGGVTKSKGGTMQCTCDKL